MARRRSRGGRRRGGRGRGGAGGGAAGGGRGGGRRGGRAPTFPVLGKSVAEMTKRFGKPERKADLILVWMDGKTPTDAMTIECWMTATDDEEARVETARIVPPSATKMSKEQLLRTIARYNGGQVQKPEDAPHEVSGGAGAIAFKNNHWAYVQRDPVGFVYGIKIWVETPP